MFVQTRPIKIYTLKFITDLASRSNQQPTADNLCPYYGMSSTVELYNNKETVASIEMLFERQNDFDADKCHPTLDEDFIGEMSLEDFKDAIQEDQTTIQYSPAVHKLDFPHYKRRIEDIHPLYLESYLGNIVFNVRNKSGGIKDFEREHKDSYSYVSIGDNGEEVTESADLLAGPQTNLSEVTSTQEALLNLPFVVKRLWSFSKLMQVNVLEYIQSYIIARDANKKALDSKTTTATLKWTDVVRVGVHNCDKFGVTTKMSDVNKRNIHAQEMFDWITGHSSAYQSFYKNYRDFLIYCSVLNINILTDNMLSYDKEFMSKLKITTVTPNDVYDVMVVDAIKSGTIPSENADTPVEYNTEDFINNTVRGFNDFILSSIDEQRKIQNMSSSERRNIENAAQYLYSYYRNKYYGEQVQPNKISWEDGFMHYNGVTVLIPNGIICDSLSDNDAYVLNYGLISEIGYYVKLTNSFLLERTMLMDVFNYVRMKDSHVECRKPKWLRLEV